MNLWKVVRKLWSYLFILFGLCIGSFLAIKSNPPKVNYNSIKYVGLKIFVLLVVLVCLGLLNYNFIITSIVFVIRFLLQFILIFGYYGNTLFRMFFFRILGLGVPLFSTLVFVEEEKTTYTVTPTIFNAYGPYFFCSLLIFRNTVHKLILHMGRNCAFIAALDQITWGVSAFIRLTGFNISGLYYYIMNNLKDFSSSYNNRL